MAKEIDITIENKLITEKRDINVFHHSTRSAHIISHQSSITLPLRSAGDGEDDYLLISVVKGPGYLWMDCVINLPSWANFDFSLEGKLNVTHSTDAGRTVLKIPPGPPTWELKITRPTRLSPIGSLTVNNANTVIIGENTREHGA
jgi:hypothetical protein